MRILTARAWIICGLALLTRSGIAQQSPRLPSADSSFSSQFTPISVEEPRTFPAPAARSPAAHYSQSSTNFRLASAEEPVASSPAQPPLRLAPRSHARRSATNGSSLPPERSATNALTTVIGSLGAVLGLFLVIVWCSRRFAPAGAALLPKEAVELLGRSSLAARQQMQLVRVGNKLLLVAHSPVGVETLTEITEPAEVEHLTALCRRGRAGSSTAGFSQALAQLSNEPAQRSFIGASRPTSRGAR
jgi:flagellar biogenesis protein FliO